MYLPVMFSWSHFEFFGVLWLSHHHEYLRLDSEWDNVVITPAQSTNATRFKLRETSFETCNKTPEKRNKTKLINQIKQNWIS